MKFERKEKLVVLLSLLLIVVIGSAWTWDVLTKSDEDAGQIGAPVELVLEKENQNGKLVPPQSVYVDRDGYSHTHEYLYTIDTEEDTGDTYTVKVNWSLSLNDLSQEEVYTVLKPSLNYDGESYTLEEGLNDINIDLDGPTEVKLEVQLNESLKGSGIGIGRIANNDYQFEVEFFVDSVND